jgi:hypothetical protein
MICLDLDAVLLDQMYYSLLTSFDPEDLLVPDDPEDQAGPVEDLQLTRSIH